MKSDIFAIRLHLIDALDSTCVHAVLLYGYAI